LRSIRNLTAWLIIIRPLNVLQSGIAVILTLIVLHEPLDVAPTLWLILAVATILAGGNVMNDLVDLEIDRVNRPNRPLPRGLIAPRAAKFYAGLLFLMGIWAAAEINSTALLIAGGGAVPLLILYNLWAKRQPFVGNLIVSLLLGLVFIFVGAAVSRLGPSWTMAGLAFGFTLIREIVKDLEDLPGDAASGARTLPVRWGIPATMKILSLLVLVFVVLDLWPYWSGQFSRAYLHLVLWTINLPLLGALVIMWRHPRRKYFQGVRAFLKAGVFLGLAAIYFGAQ